MQKKKFSSLRILKFCEQIVIILNAKKEIQFPHNFKFGEQSTSILNAKACLIYCKFFIVAGE
jgi:hypothetical protein